MEAVIYVYEKKYAAIEFTLQKCKGKHKPPTLHIAAAISMDLFADLRTYNLP